MFAQPRSIAVLLVVAAVLAGCGSTTVNAPTLHATAAPKTPVAVPSPSASAVPAGPYAVVVTNAQRQGSSYDIMLIDLQGEVVTKVTARLPLLKPNQTITLPLVSATNDLVYYLDGDTDIRSLSSTGVTALAKTIAGGSTSILAFAVSADDQHIAVALINQAADIAKTNGHGYVEDLADNANHKDLFSNLGSDAFRWPIGWHGNDIVDAVGNQCNGPYGSAYSGACAASYHVISSVTGARRATVCEGPAAQAVDANQNISPTGLPVAGGVACLSTEYYFGSNSGKPNEGAILAIDWSSHATTLVSADKTGQLPVNSCFLAPGGTEMACQDNSSQALTVISRGAAPHSLGRRYTILGWMDAAHLLVDIDTKTLAVLNISSGTGVNLTLADADKVEMAGAAPGAL